MHPVVRLLHQRSRPDAQEAELSVQGHALQAGSSRVTERGGVADGNAEGMVPCEGGEVLEAELDAHAVGQVPLAGEVLGQALAQTQEDARELRPVPPCVEIPVEGSLAANGFGFPRGRQGAVISAMGSVKEPRAIAPAEVPDEEVRIGLCKLTDGADPEALQFLRGLGADAVDGRAGQGPDPRGDVL